VHNYIGDAYGHPAHRVALAAMMAVTPALLSVAMLSANSISEKLGTEHVWSSNRLSKCYVNDYVCVLCLFDL